MKKRIIVIIISVLTLIGGIFGLSGCVSSCLHTWDKGIITKEATCIEKGEKTFSCSRCGETKTEEISFGGHVFGEETIIKQATCKEAGEKVVTCTICDVTETQTIPATGEHTFDDGTVIKEAGCTEAGEKKFVCSVCGDEETEEIPAIGEHTFDNGTLIKEPGCVEPGVKKFVCSVCGEEELQDVPAIGHHDFDDGTVQTQPTCVDKGVKKFVCIVCGEEETEEIPATGEHSYDEGQVIKQATCKQTGVKKYTCTVCQHTKEEDIPLVEGHVFDKGEVLVEPTCTKEGLGLYTCTLCGEKVEKAIAMLPVAYTITMQGYGEFLVPESGEYSLENAEKIGYNFVKWVDESGKDFASAGTVNKDVTVKPVFNVADTTTVEQLEERAAAGVDYIKIAKDIVVDRTIYLFNKTVIYSEKAVTLIRAPRFAGDMFVIGQDKDGNSHVLTNGSTEVAFGKEDGSSNITIDGNSSKTAVDVVGSALFIVNGSIVDMYEGVSVVNHTKVGNERILLYEEYIGTTKGRVGGAGAIVVSGSFTMHGGLFENNIVNTVNVGSAETEDATYYVSSYGGAIYNCGTFTMKGGAIKNSVANRGGAIFTQKIVKIQAGTLEGNYAENKGGAICAWETSYCDTIIGTETATLGSVLIKNNAAKIQGGAILSYGVSPIVVLGGARFEGNRAETSVGGVIATTGPITVYNSEFINNYAYVSGGTIYQSYEGEDKQPHIVTLEGCLFDGNKAGRGGAMLISAAEEVNNFTTLVINDCTFKNNGANYRLVDVTDKETGVTTQQNYYGSGGAIYVTKGTILKVDNSIFEGNTAELSAGAVYVTTDTQTTISNSLFLKNKAVRYGAAIYAGSAKSLSVSYCEFAENGFIQDGVFTTERGAGIYATDTPVTALQCQYVGNNASYGAAVYVAGSASYTDQAASTTKASLFENNHANRGGAIALYGKVDVSFAEFKDNTATQHGGAIYLGTDAILTVKNSAFTNNSVTVANVDEDENHFGGAIGLINGDVTANNCTFIGNKLTAEEGENTFKLYGGGVGASGQSVVYITNSQFAENSAGYGGAISALGFKSNTFETVNITLSKNSSTNCGGGIYVNDATATVENVVATENTSKNGGVIYASDCAKFTVKGESHFEKNTATSGGGALYFTTGTLSVTGATFKENSGIEGGAIRVLATETTSAIVQINNVNFENNASTNGGGALYVTDGSATITASLFTQNQAGSNGGAISFMRTDVEIRESTFTGNTALEVGGAIFTTQSNQMQTKTISCGFIDNTATTNGGAIYTTGTGKHADENSTFTGNTAKSGGAVHLFGEITLTGSKLQNNTATSGGAIYVSKGAISLANVSFMENTASGNGGAIYVAAGAKVTDENSTYTKSSAVNGGVVYIAATTEEQTVGGEYSATGVSFTENSATSNGGVICAYNNANVELIGVSVINNTASNNGGVLWTYTGSLTQIQGIIAKGNKATGHGGVMYTRGDLTILSGENVTNVFGGTETTEANTSGAEGGAIKVLSTEGVASVIQINGASFINNTSTNGGGAIYVTDGDVTITDSQFIQNEAGGNGGAITFNNTDAEITGTTFDGNSTPSDGGAIYTTQSNNGKQTKTVSCTFINHSTAARGGAIYVTTTGKHVDENSTFDTNNSVKGGALHVYGEALLTGSIVKNNTATSGGAIYVSKGTLSLVNVTFTENAASENGGAIYLLAGAKIVDENSTFTGNTAVNGGAIYVESTEENQTVGGEYSATGVSFMENTATSGGGAIYVGINGKAIIGTATFTSNKVSLLSTAEDGNYFGGAIAVFDGQLTVTDSTFTGNTFTAETVEGKSFKYYGGAIGVTGNSVISVNGGTFTENNASYGGSISAFALEYNTFDVKNVTFTNNSSTNCGAAIYANNVTATLENVTATNNTSKNGGAIYVSDCASFTIKGESNFENNIATEGGSGGAVYFTKGTLSITGATFTQNSGAEGGAIRVVAAETNPAVITIDKAIFESNTSTNGGGAMYVTDGDVTITDSEFVKNTAGTNGGAISFMRADVQMTECTFNENNASNGNGGAIYTTQSNTSVKKNGTNTISCIFKNNNASKNAGAIYVTGTGKHEDKNSTFDSNTAVNGGAAYNPANGSLTLNGSILKNNDATSGLGGAIYSASTTKITNATFTSNEAANGGGAIYASGGTTTVTGGSMTENAVTTTGDYTRMGGAIAVAKSTTVSVSGVTFTQNSATSSGGAIAVYGTSAVATVENCSFTGHSAGNGGTFYIGGEGAITLTNVTVKESNATTYGAVVYTTSGSASTLTVNSITLYNNCTDKNTKTSYGFIYLNNVKNVLNINKGNFVVKDAQTEEAVTVSDWSTLIWNTVNAPVNEITTA